MLLCTGTGTPEINALSLHDALPIFDDRSGEVAQRQPDVAVALALPPADPPVPDRVRPLGVPRGRGRLAEPVLGQGRSEEHTSELQSRLHLVCRLLLEKKNKGPPASA